MTKIAAGILLAVAVLVAFADLRVGILLGVVALIIKGVGD